MKWLGVLIFIICIGVPFSPVHAWDCQDPAIDCSTLIVRRTQPDSGMSLQSLGSSKIPSRPSTIQVPTGIDPQDYLDQLESDEEVLLVEPALKTHLVLSESAPITPNDPLLDEQNHLNGFSGTNLAIEDAWSIVTEGTVIVAVIDSGVDYTHPDLAANIWTNIGEIPNNGIDDDDNGYIDDIRGYNFFNHTPDPYDQHLHGTHMAGIIGAVGNNLKGVTGLLWKTEIMPLRFTDSDGVGDTVKAIEAIHYAVENGARVINMSWTIIGDGAISKSLQQTIASYENEGIVFVTAAGNGDVSFIGFDIDEQPVYPAAFKLSNLITVGASDPLGELTTFSNYGSKTVHLLAPGANILSTFPGNDYGRMSGTSAATAVVSAAAAMALTYSPTLSAADVKNLLLQTVNYNADLNGLVQSSGTLNMVQPLEFLISGKTITAPNFPDYSSSDSQEDNDVAPAPTGFATSGGCQLNRGGDTSQLPLAFMLVGVIITGLAIIRFS